MKPAIVVMSRVPRPGETKTRLMAKLTGEECAALHLACLKDIFATVGKVNVPGYVYFTDTTDIEIPSYFIKRYQRGDDLGERLYNTAVEILTGHDKVVFLGADLPDITQVWRHIFPNPYIPRVSGHQPDFVVLNN